MNAYALESAADRVSGAEWNNLDRKPWEHILTAIIVIGVVGLLIEQGMNAMARRFDYRSD